MIFEVNCEGAAFAIIAMFDAMVKSNTIEEVVHSNKELIVGKGKFTYLFLLGKSDI